MLLDTKYLGEVEIDEEMIIQFESGIPGFQEEKEFAILDIPGNDLIQMMQSVKNSELAFLLLIHISFTMIIHFLWTIIQ